MTDTTTERTPLLTDVERAAIQARLAAATPGPWTATPMGSEGSIITAGGMTIRSARRVARVSEFADADAIVDVMNAFPALLVENQRLRDTIQAVKALRDVYRDLVPHVANQIDQALDGRDPIDVLRERLSGVSGE